MKALLLILFFLAGAFCRAGEPPAPSGEGIRLATWNVRNYLLQNRWHDGAYRFNYPKPEAEKTRLREVIHEVNPDLLLLQEIGSEPFLRELRDDLAAEGLAYPYLHFQGIPESRTGLALLSRIAPAESILLVPPPSVADESRPAIVRGVHELLIRQSGAAIRIFHLHLKSRYTTWEEDPESRNFREAEIRRLRQLLAPRRGISGSSETLVLAGDFNTPFTDPLLQPLRNHWEPVPVADAEGEAWTYHHYKSGRREVIDGFWVLRAAGDGNPALAGPSPKSALRPVGIFPALEEPPASGDPDEPTASSTVPDTQPPPETPDLTAQIGSDHRMVVIEWVPGKET